MVEDKEFAILVSDSDIYNFDFAEEIKKELEKRDSKVMVMHLYPRMEMDEIIDCLKDSFWPSNWIIIGEAANHIEQPYMLEPVTGLLEVLRQGRYLQKNMIMLIFAIQLRW